MIAGTAVGVLALTSLAAAGSATSTGVSTSVPTVAVSPSTQSGGLLVLTTGPGSVGTVTYKRPNVADVTQSLTAASCAMVTTPSLLGFKGFVNGNPSTVGLRNGSIGVKADSSTAMACGRVSTTSTTTESLQIDVNVGRPNGAVKPVATSAFLDIEVKGNAKIEAITSLNGVPNGVYELQAGTSIGSAPTLLSSVDSEHTHVTNPNCGALIDPYDDDGYRDNCRFAISVPSWLGPDDGNVFDSITLKAISGSFSLEGGADGSITPAPPAEFPQKGSIFELSESTLSCSDTTSLPGSATLVGIDITRLNNATPGECTPIPFRLIQGATSFEFLKPVSIQNEQFVLTPTWPVPGRANTVGDQPTISYQFPGMATPQPITWCAAPNYASDGTLIGVNTPFASLPDLDLTTAGTQYTCLATSNARMASDGTGLLTIVQQIYLVGDVRYGW